jgi:hypothetical protein
MFRMGSGHSCFLALLVCLSEGAFAYPGPLPGTEDIPKMMADSVLVCKGEVVEAPIPKFSRSLADASDLRANVRPDRCFKGSLNGSSIQVLFDGFISGVGPSFVLHKGDYRLFFLKSQKGAYAVVDRWFGALSVSHEHALLPATDDGMYALELELKAGLRDSSKERVLDSIQMLGNMKHLRSTSELTTLLEHSDLLVKTYIWQALLRLKDYSVLPAVSEFFESQPEVPRELILPRDRLFEMQDELIREIGAIREPQTLPFLERFAVTGKGYILRMNAIQALRAIHSPDSAPAFLKALGDPHPDNGFFAMQGLLSLAGPGQTDWVPTWKKFDEAPGFYAEKCREWWRTEGQLRMLSKDSARPF